jgi:hypothetical protein
MLSLPEAANISCKGKASCSSTWSWQICCWTVEDAVSGGSAEHIVETEQWQLLSSAFFSINIEWTYFSQEIKFQQLNYTGASDVPSPSSSSEKHLFSQKVLNVKTWLELITKKFKEYLQ